MIVRQMNKMGQHMRRMAFVLAGLMPILLALAMQPASAMSPAAPIVPVVLGGAQNNTTTCTKECFGTRYSARCTVGYACGCDCNKSPACQCTKRPPEKPVWNPFGDFLGGDGDDHPRSITPTPQ